MISFDLICSDGMPTNFLFKLIFSVTISGSVLMLEFKWSMDRYDPLLFVFSLMSLADKTGDVFVGVTTKFSFYSGVVSFRSFFTIFGNFGSLS